MKSTTRPQYTTLAEIYDSVMENVDYEMWSDFIDEIIQTHHPSPQNVLELACGTGSLSLALDRYNCYQIVGTDKSAAMVAKAREKAATGNPRVAFRRMDFLDITLQQTFDIVVSIFDSVNYLHSKEDVRQLLNQARKVMNTDSLFIFDFTTPKNSEQAIKYLNNEEGITPNNYHFFRKSEYDADRQIHYNTFEIDKLADDRREVLEQVIEEHRQRTYSLKQMQDIITGTDFEIVAKYSEFDLDEATPESLRITMVLRCPNTQ